MYVNVHCTSAMLTLLSVPTMILCRMVETPKGMLISRSVRYQHASQVLISNLMLARAPLKLLDNGLA